MSFNTGAALLDAIVLAVVGREETGTYGYRITRMCAPYWTYPNPRCIPFCAACKRTAV